MSKVGISQKRVPLNAKPLIADKQLRGLAIFDQVTGIWRNIDYQTKEKKPAELTSSNMLMFIFIFVNTFKMLQVYYCAFL
jgi:hypothetical protein